MISYMLIRIQACPIDGPMWSTSVESLQKNYVIQDGVNLAKASKTE